VRKFNFRLERVRQYRRQLEEQAKKELQETQLRVREAEKELENMLQHRQETLQQALNTVADRRATLDYVCFVDEKCAGQESIIAILQQDEEMMRAKWIQARQDAELLEKLKTKAKDQYDLDANRHEQAELDEWTMMRRDAA